jgi:rare lipoprotein A
MMRRCSLACAALVLSGCASDGHMRLSPFPAPKTPAAKHGPIDARLPVMPAAGSGRGGYYLDDGPGDNPPPGLYDLPDPIVKNELLSKYGNKPYVVFGKTYTPLGGDSSFVQRGVASWYGKKFHGQRTSSGEPYDMYQLSAAHPTLPIPSYARVTSIETGKSVVVRVNDRGPFHSSRIIDVSYTAALKLGLLGKGSHEVEVERLMPEDPARIATARRNSPAPVALATVPLAPTADATLVSAPVTMSAATDIVALAPAVATLPGPAPAPTLAQAPVATDGFYLQLGAFSQAANAAEARARVLATGIVSLVEIVQAGSLHRLFGGPFATREEALKAAGTLPAGLAIKALVVKRSGSTPN